MRIISDNPIHDRVFQSFLRLNMFFEAVEYVQKHNLEYEYYDFEMSFNPPKDYIGMINKKYFGNLSAKKEISSLYNEIRDYVKEKNITIYTAKHIEREGDEKCVIPLIDSFSIDSFGAYYK